MKIISKSVAETMGAGAKLAKRLKAGDVVALIGDLGTGKTVFTKGIARGLGVRNYRYVNSPTFVFIKEYRGKLPLYHFDIYRLDHIKAFDLEAYQEYFYGDGVTVVEWADRIADRLPARRIEVHLAVKGAGARSIAVRLPEGSA